MSREAHTTYRRYQCGIGQLNPTPNQQANTERTHCLLRSIISSIVGRGEKQKSVFLEAKDLFHFHGTLWIHHGHTGHPMNRLCTCKGAGWGGATEVLRCPMLVHQSVCSDTDFQEEGGLFLMHSNQAKGAMDLNTMLHPCLMVAACSFRKRSLYVAEALVSYWWILMVK